MLEALIEAGIGETRALVLDGGDVVELHIERHDGGLRCGDVFDARLTAILLPGRRGIVTAGSIEALLEPLPAALTEGALVRVEIVREALAEAGRAKLAKARATGAAAGRAPGRVAAGHDLAARLAASGFAPRTVGGHGADALEAAGWSEWVEAATTGRVAFDGGSLTISPTPAMTVIDVDGALPPPDLARAAATAAAEAIRRFGIGGSIGIDFPGCDRAARQAVGTRLDAALPLPFERTAVNGFGFVQIVRPRPRASVTELLRGDPVAAAALALLRAAERSVGTGTRTLTAAPAVTAWLAARPDLTAELARRLGAPVALHDDARLAISAGHADCRP